MQLKSNDIESIEDFLKDAGSNTIYKDCSLTANGGDFGYWLETWKARVKWINNFKAMLSFPDYG